MSRPIYFEERFRSRWRASVVLVAVCSLTISLATRYSSPWIISSHVVKTVQTHASPESKRQRLAENAANWMPPVFTFEVLQAPSFYPQIAIKNKKN